jgi:hypothetical protein
VHRPGPRAAGGRRQARKRPLTGPPGARAARARRGGRSRDDRFGDRTRRGTAASFRCAQCGDLAGVVRIARADTAAEIGRLPGRNPTASRLVLDCFLGRSWHAAEPATLDAVQGLIEQGNVDPIAIRAISWPLWLVTPFYCPECRLNYYSGHWDPHADLNVGFWDCIIGICPKGHRHLVG